MHKFPFQYQLFIIKIFLRVFFHYLLMNLISLQFNENTWLDGIQFLFQKCSL